MCPMLANEIYPWRFRFLDPRKRRPWIRSSSPASVPTHANSLYYTVLTLGLTKVVPRDPFCKWEGVRANRNQLKEIDLTDCRINDAGDWNISVSSVIVLKGFHSYSWNWLPVLQHLTRCSELLTLKLGPYSSISYRGLEYISSNCGKLIELDLYW
jgi:hypothetical protein